MSRSATRTEILPGVTRALALAFVALIWLGAAGCAVTLISQYDEQIDRTATALQLEMDTFLTSLEGEPQPTYAASEAFYRNYEVKLRSVLLRAQSHPKNTITVQQLQLMMKNLDELRVLHNDDPVNVETIATTRDLFNLGWQAIIKLELAKQRGER